MQPTRISTRRMSGSSSAGLFLAALAFSAAAAFLASAAGSTVGSILLNIPSGSGRALILLRQYLYFCTSKASKVNRGGRGIAPSSLRPHTLVA